MRRLRKLALPLAIITVLGWWLWPQSTATPAKDIVSVLDGGDLRPLVNRVWIDKIPLRERDKVQVFVMLDDPRMGAFSTSSAYEGAWTSFEWSREGGLRFRMLQADKTHKVSARVIRGTSCAPFDYCLRLKGPPHAAKQYGSMEDWVFADQDLSPSQMIHELFFASR